MLSETWSAFCYVKGGVRFTRTDSLQVLRDLGPASLLTKLARDCTPKGWVSSCLIKIFTTLTQRPHNTGPHRPRAGARVLGLRSFKFQV